MLKLDSLTAPDRVDLSAVQPKSLHIRFIQYSGMASMNFVDLYPSKGKLLPYLRGAEISLWAER